MKTTAAESIRFEPTVLGAARRYSVTVLATALLVAALGVGFTLVAPDQFRASGNLTVPQPTSLADGGNGQYLDSQVLLLQSDDVAARALTIANMKLGRTELTLDNLVGDNRAVRITPPATGSSGSYGANTIGVSFTWSDAGTAQVGSNAVLQAFDEARSAAITAQGDATIAGIERAIDDARSADQRGELESQRTRALVDQQVDLAQHPMIDWAGRPLYPINNNSKQAGAIGLLVGILLGVAIAYVRARRHTVFADRFDPAALYGVPLIGDVPASQIPPPFRRALGARLPVSEAPRSVAAESFRLAADSIDTADTTAGSPQLIVFVSPRGGAGKSAIVANLALAVAESGTRRVLVVDADPMGGLSGLLLPGATPEGFRRVLAGEGALQDFARPSPLNTAVKVLGADSGNSTRVTGAAYTEAIGKLIAQAADDGHDVVLVDSPAFLEMADAPALAAAANAAVVIVVGADDLIKDHVLVGQRLEMVESHVLGFVYGHRPVRSNQRSVGNAYVVDRAAPDQETDRMPAVSPVAQLSNPVVDSATSSSQ